MEFIFEIIFNIFLDVCLDKEISKWIRYPALSILILLYIGVVILFIWFGMTADNLLMGSIMWIIVMFLLTLLIFPIFKKTTKKR